ncbi:MAG TPA: gliding motility-associated C-terminal domain-containing protein, partial [Catalimonadaceae bacterium]|nr:gliding motility-associated C-terminal domain-containing protein [Catalimonadaceae bacterium]
TLRLNDRKITVIPAFDVIRSYEGCEQPYYVFQNSTINGEVFIWDFGDGVKSTEVNPKHQYNKPGLYDVKLDAFKQGCLETKIQKLRVNEFSVPNLLTINDDEKNDVFIINGLEEGWVLEIFNRWGKNVYQTNSYKNDWKPDSLSAGVYFYNIRFPGNYHCNGWVEVVKE